MPVRPTSARRVSSQSIVAVWAVSSRSKTGTSGLAEAVGEAAGVAGALAQLVLEGEVAEQGALQRLDLVDLGRGERAELADSGPTTWDPPTWRMAWTSRAERSLLFSTLAASSSARACAGLRAAHGRDGLLERGEAEQVVQLADEHVAGDGHGGLRGVGVAATAALCCPSRDPLG